MKTEVDLFVFGSSILTCNGDGKPKIEEKLSDVGLVYNGAIAVKDGIIVGVGSKDEILSRFKLMENGQIIDAQKCPVLPGLIDSHTHPVFGGNRVSEFIMRAQGATYQEIHSIGGGIQFTVDVTRANTFENLYKNAKKVLYRMLEHGTTTIEAKSGYGLETVEELRELRVINKLGEDLPLDVVPTFMGAHSIPREYSDNPEAYIQLVLEDMLPNVREENLAKFVDVFCEEGAFNLEQTKKILNTAKMMGFSIKIHAEEFTNLGGAVLAGSIGAVSADHLLKISDKDIKQLAKTNTILTLMPGTLFFLDYNEFAPARKIIKNGGKIALASDYNAGSCLSASMPMVMSLGCIKMKMTPEEVINACTYNASFAVGMEKEIGSIEKGKKADFVIFDIDDYRLIPYHFGENLVKAVIKEGKIVVQK